MAPSKPLPLPSKASLLMNFFSRRQATKPKCWALATVLTLAVSGGGESLYAQAAAVAPLYPPLVLSEDGRTASGGISVELVREAFRRAGQSVVIAVEPFARAYHTATVTDTFLFPLAKTEERDRVFEWIGQVNRLDYQLFRKAGSPTPRLDSLAALGSHAVGVLTQDLIAIKLKESKLGVLSAVNDVRQLVRLVMSGRVEYIAATLPAIRAELESQGLLATALESALDLKDLQVDGGSYLAIRKGALPVLVRRLRQSFLSMQQDGTWEEIFRRAPSE